MICRIESDARIARGFNEVRETPAWERVRIQIYSGAVDTVGPKEIAKAFEMKETATGRRGIGHVAANVSAIKNYGEKKIIGYAEDGEGTSLRIQCADVKASAEVGS